MLSDTDPDAAEVQWEILRRMTSSQRSSLMAAMTTTAFNHSKRAIARSNPGATQREINHIFISVHYGEDLARQVTAYLQARDVEANNAEPTLQTENAG